MKVLRKRDMTEEKYTNAFLGYGPEDAHFAIELTYSENLTNLLTFLIITELCILSYFNIPEQWKFLCLNCFSLDDVSDYGIETYDIGTGFGHFGIAMDDVSFSSFYDLSIFYAYSHHCIKNIPLLNCVISR